MHLGLCGLRLSPPIQPEAWDPACSSLPSPSPALTPQGEPTTMYLVKRGKEFVLTGFFWVGIQLGVIFKEDRRSKVSGIIQTSHTLALDGVLRKFMFNSSSQKGRCLAQNYTAV